MLILDEIMDQSVQFGLDSFLGHESIGRKAQGDHALHCVNDRPG